MKVWLGVFVLLAGLGATMAADTIPATGGNIELTPMTHAHVQIEYGGKVIHIDPTSQSNLAAAKPADIVLVTDVHGDHMTLPLPAMVQERARELLLIRSAPDWKQLHRVRVLHQHLHAFVADPNLPKVSRTGVSSLGPRSVQTSNHGPL